MTSGSLNGKVAIVTGSGRGIGAATALELASGGADIVVNYRSDAQSAERVRQRIHELGGRAVTVHADVSTAEGAAALNTAAHDEFGRVDILVGNAGPLFRPIPVTDMSWDDLSQIVDTDLRCAFHSTAAVLPSMIEHEYGRLVYIGSGSAAHPTPGLAHHGAARAAVTAYARSVAAETGMYGVTANVVAPGMVQTDRTAGSGFVDRVASMTPAGRIATPEDVARAVRFFVSDEEGFYTGVTFPVDGGLGM